MLKKILILAAGLVVFLAAGPVAAQYGGTFSATVSNTNPQPGETITIEGSCTVGEVVEVSLESSSRARAAIPLGTIDVGDDDTFSGPITIPGDLAPGDYSIIATCGGEVLSIDITVGARRGPSGPLSNTGASSTGLLLKLGGGLVLAGAAFALVATKRRRVTA